VTVLTKKELLRQLRALTRYDAEVDPYSSGASPLAIMEKERHGAWVEYWDLERLIQEAE